MSRRDYAKTQIDTLPENVVEKVIEFIFSLSGNDTEFVSDDEVMSVSRRLMGQNKEAYEVLAK